MLAVEGLVKRFGGRLVLRGARLRVEKGSIGVVLGPNGAGKTTLLNSVAGILAPEEGRILVDGRLVYEARRGRPVVNVPPEERGAALVPQDYALYPHLTVYENIEFGLRARRVPEGERRRRVLEAAELLGVSHLLGAKPQGLSGGERQRVAIARALVVEPRLLLLDEPFSAMDARSREVLRRELRSLLHRLGVTTVMVTHSFADAWTMGDRIAVLIDGRVVAEGPPEQLASKPLSAGVAEYLGYTVLPAKTLGPTKDGGCLVEVEGLGALEASNTKGDCRPGAPARVAFRGDDIVVSTKPLTAKNTFEAVVEEALVTRYGVRLLLNTGTLSLWAETGRGVAAALLGGQPKPGARVYAHIPPETIEVAPA